MNKKKLFIIVNNDFFFLSHRLQIGIAALKAGYDVIILAKDNGFRKEIENYGLKFRNVYFDRSKNSIGKKVLLVYQLYKIYKREKPDIVHHVTLFASIAGGLAARLSGCHNVVNAITGFGYNFTKRNVRVRVRVRVITYIMSLALKNKRSYYIVQNNDDFKQIINENFTIKEHIFLIKGSGVCLKEFSYQDPVKKDILRVLLPARMLLDKGIKEFCNAALILKDKFSNKAEFILTGDLDLINGAGISKKKLLKLLDEPYLIWSGYSNNIKEQLCYADVVVLPSYREGLPKSLIDACAVGRPIITTDAIGCKECVIEGYNGYLVPVGDAQTLADKIEILLNDEQLRIEMGKNARKFAEENFDINDVVNKHLEIYETILKKQQ